MKHLTEHQLELFSPEPQAPVPKSPEPPLPPYQVRESAKARHVSIRISPQGRIEVVVPKTFDQRQLPDIVRRRQDWILKTMQRLQSQQQDLAPEHFVEKPTCLELRSRQETWEIRYQPSPRRQLSLHQTAPHTLTLQGTVEESAFCNDLLRQWLTRKAHAEFAPWLRELSFTLGLPFSQVSVRGQKTRWASCSTNKNISLNYKLLFLPTDLVHYVFVHELCHTIHMNHSRAFWRLVQEKLPAYGLCREGLKDAWQYIPQWIEVKP